MAFQIIKAESRTASMLQWFSLITDKITDFAIGSKMRTKFESLAVEMERQDYEFEQTVRQGIPLACYDTFSFAGIPITKATGIVTFTSLVAPSGVDIRIPKGTRLTTVETSTSPAKVYETMADAYMLNGHTTVNVPVTAVVAGAIGNTPASSISVISTTIQGIDTVNNTGGIIGGTDAETDDARRIRFQEYIASLDRTSGHAVEYGAKTTIIYDGFGNVSKRVLQAKVFEPFVLDGGQPAGTITCYIFSGQGKTTGDVVTEAQKIVNGYVTADGTSVAGYKAAGVVCNVVAATEDATNITMAVNAPNTTTDTKTLIHDQIVTALTSYITSLKLEEKLVRSKLVDIAMGITGVYNVNSGTLLPAADVTAATGHVITAGTITVTVTE